MKKFLFILSFVFVSAAPLWAQDDADDDNGGNEKIRDRMSEFIQKRLDVSKEEANRFAPIFVRYFKEWRQIIRENKGDRLVLQQKVVDLQLRFRPLFREVIGDRGDRVYEFQKLFIENLRRERNERLRNNPGPVRRRVVNRLL